MKTIMRAIFFKNVILSIPFLIFVFNPWKSNAQQITVDKSNQSFFYISSAFVSSSTINHETLDPYFTISDQIANHRTLRFDIGFNFKKNTSFEIGYLGNWMNTETMLTIDGDRIPLGFSSMARISMYSLVLTHNFNLYNNRVFLTPGLGYAIGDYSELPVWPRTPDETRSDFDHEITTSSVSQALTDGNGRFLVLKIGVEVALFKKLNIFSKLFIHKGMTNIMAKETMYTINQDKGSHKITSDGSAQGIELGLKFNFR